MTDVGLAADVRSPLPGQTKEINADFKTPVKTGQILATIDPSTYEARVKQRRRSQQCDHAKVMATRTRGFTKEDPK